MHSDSGLEVTRAVREKISREHGNNPRLLVEYYIDYQRRFANRLRSATPLNRKAESPEDTPSVDTSLPSGSHGGTNAD
jgi:hypothetical protein